jgi:hypothetical protein
MTTLQSGAALSMSRADRTRVEVLLIVIELSHIDGAKTSVSRCSLDRLNTFFEAIHLPLQPRELRGGRAAGRVRRLNVEYLRLGTSVRSFSCLYPEHAPPVVEA